MPSLSEETGGRVSMLMPGSTIGIIGGTGSGKSSLANLICRLYDVDQGSVCVGGVDVRSYDMEALREQVSVVLQKNTLFSVSYTHLTLPTT